VRLLVGVSTRKPGFNPRLGRVTFLVDDVAVAHVFVRVTRFFPVSIIQLTPHTHSLIHPPQLFDLIKLTASLNSTQTRQFTIKFSFSPFRSNGAAVE
jgi:hypothetical protein